MLASDIITACREALSDEKVPYRHSDAELLRYLSRALTELWSLHAEAFWFDDFTVDPPAAITAVTSTIPHFDPLWTNAVVHHICSKVLAQDSESEGNRGLGADHWKHWLEEI